MKNKKIIALIISTGLICLILGIFIGAKLFAKVDTRPFIDMVALKKSSELTQSAILLEALNNGKTQEVMDVLYVDIKTNLEILDDYDQDGLYEDTKKRIKDSRQSAKAVLERYPNPKFSNNN